VVNIVKKVLILLKAFDIQPLSGKAC